jgi:hypothetical protein
MDAMNGSVRSSMAAENIRNFKSRTHGRAIKPGAPRPGSGD